MPITFSELPGTEKEAVIFLQAKGILHSRRICRNCLRDMKLSFGQKIFFKCFRCGIKKGVAVGSWLWHKKLPFNIIVQMIFCWAKKFTPIKTLKSFMNINRCTCIAWNIKLDDICIQKYNNSTTRKIGGWGRTVEIDETLFSKRKYNVGAMRNSYQWVFGGICRETKECFIKFVEDRTQETLLDLIKKNVEVGTNLQSDCWAGYNTSQLTAAGYTHQKVNHRYNFIDPITGAHTQNIERQWREFKKSKIARHGIPDSRKDAYIAEYMWRKCLNGADPFEQILEDIAQFYPPA